MNIFYGKFSNPCFTQSILNQSKSQRLSTITEMMDFGQFSKENSQINNQPNQHFGRNINCGFLTFWTEISQSTKSTFCTEHSQILALPKQDTFQLTGLSSVGTGGVVENVGDGGIAARGRRKKGWS